MKLTTEQAIIEQLALGNKCKSIDYQVVVDLATKRKTEKITAEFAAILTMDEQEEMIYFTEAQTWLEWFKSNRGTLMIVGRQGQVATLPINRKDKDLPSILRAFSR